MDRISVGYNSTDMKVWSDENPVVIEVFLNPITKLWEAAPVKNADGYGDLPDISLEFLTMLGDPDMQPSSVGNNPNFLSSLTEQTRQSELLADLRRIMGTD